MYHGVKVYSCTRLPVTTSSEGSTTKTTTTNGILLVNGAIAQPVVVNQYSSPEKIPLSNDYAVSLFYDYGTKTLAPDLVLKWQVTA